MENPKAISKDKVMIVITYISNLIFIAKDIKRNNMTASCYNMKWKHCLS